jgi:hypothetical protein
MSQQYANVSSSHKRQPDYVRQNKVIPVLNLSPRHEDLCGVEV